MLDNLLQWFVMPGFMPHSFCLLKNPAIMTLHVASDGFIALAYFSIPIALASFVRRRKDLVFTKTFLLFALFILSCGTTHLLDIWTLWHPDYLLQGLVKALTAVVSIVTAVLLWPVLEKAMALPSPSQLAAVNEELSREARLRQAALRDMEGEVNERRELETRLRENERLLKTVLDTAADGILTTNGQGRIELCNPAVASMFGYAIADLVGMELSRLMTLNPETRASDGPAQAGPFAAVPGHEFLGRRQDGSTFPLEVTVGGNTSVLRDITQRKASEAAIRELNATLERKVEERTAELAIASAAKSQFLANMSHEIRTPLNVLLGLAQVLERDTLPAHQRQLLDRMREAGGALLNVINDILDLSKIESGQVRLEEAPFELAEVLSGLDQRVRDAAKQKGLEFTVGPAPDCPGRLVGDVNRLRQVLINLCGNAIKFTHRGHVRVSTHLLDVTPGSAHLRFEVEDTGIGIAPEVLAGLFKPFTQADESITRQFGGAGLGLSISKRLVDFMGGRLEVVSQVNKGSTFWFELSFGRAEAAPPTAVTAPAARGQRLAGCKVLVVDDNRMNQFLVEKALQLEGATVTVADDGLQALDGLQARPGDIAVVLMDIQMPVMDGLTATRAIREDPHLAGLPVIALSAGVLAEERQKAFDAGVDDFLTKPVDLERMVAAILARLPAVPPKAVPQSPAPESARAAPEAIPRPRIPGIDAQRAGLSLGGNWAFFRQLLTMFVEEFDGLGRVLHTDVTRNDPLALGRRLHKLRGSAGNLGALDVMRSAQSLEELIKAGQLPAASQLDAFAAQLDALIASARAWLAEGETTATAPVTTTLDPERLRALRAALGSNDLAALNLFAELETAIGGAYGQVAAQAMAQAIRSLRFQEVLERLAEAG